MQFAYDSKVHHYYEGAFTPRSHYSDERDRKRELEIGNPREQEGRSYTRGNRFEAHEGEKRTLDVERRSSRRFHFAGIFVRLLWKNFVIDSRS